MCKKLARLGVCVSSFPWLQEEMEEVIDGFRGALIHQKIMEFPWAKAWASSPKTVCVCVCVQEIGQEGVCVASFPLKLGDDEEGVHT